MALQYVVSKRVISPILNAQVNDIYCDQGTRAFVQMFQVLQARSSCSTAITLSSVLMLRLRWTPRRTPKCYYCQWNAPRTTSVLNRVTFLGYRKHSHRDMYQLDNVANETHHSKANCDCLRDLEVLCQRRSCQDDTP